MKLKGRRDRTYVVLSHEMFGNSKVKVKVQEIKEKKGDLIPVGNPAEGVGGFKYAKDFNYNTAFQAAFEVAADKASSGMVR